MSLRNTKENYGSIAKLFHWLIFILILFMILLGFLMGYIDNNSLRGTAYTIHKSFGLLILFLMVLRIIWLLINPKPRLPEHMNSFMKFCAHAMHILLYLVILMMPIAGLLLSSYAGYPSSFFGLFSVILPVAKNQALSNLFGDIHEYLAFTIVVLVIVHVLAALKHHIIYKDNVLTRMMPGKKNEI